MVSLQASHSQEERKLVTNLNLFSSKKRKWQEEEDYQISNKEDFIYKQPKLWEEEQLDDDDPLPSEWHRCLDVRSGQIHFYNTRTQKRTSKDPRSTTTLKPPSNSTLNLELNLNLTNSTDHKETGKTKHTEHSSNRLPLWISPDVDRKEEMVAAVCMKCHMLVMMCKESPLCPNCKFVHATTRPGVFFL